MWSPPEGMGGYIFLYLVVIAILVRTLLSCCEVPSVALVPELTQDYDERTLLMRFRYLFGWAGGLLMLFLAFGVFLVPDEGHAVGQLNPEGYWAYGLTGGALIAVAVLFSAAMQHKRVARWPDKKPDIVTPREALHEIREIFPQPRLPDPDGGRGNCVWSRKALSFRSPIISTSMSGSSRRPHSTSIRCCCSPA